MIGVAVIGGIALIAVLQHHSLNGSVNAGYLGLALSYALGVSSSLSDLVRDPIQYKIFWHEFWLEKWLGISF